jgi:hypothetical protein
MQLMMMMMPTTNNGLLESKTKHRERERGEKERDQQQPMRAKRWARKVVIQPWRFYLTTQSLLPSIYVAQNEFPTCTKIIISSVLQLFFFNPNLPKSFTIFFPFCVDRTIPVQLKNN